MKLLELAADELARRLREEGLSVRTGPFVFRMHCPFLPVAEAVGLLYANYQVVDAQEFADFAVTVCGGLGLHRWWRPQARFVLDGLQIFEPLPQGQAYPLLEWSMNWCISSHAHQYLIIHAAVLERAGRALILPAPSGSGKSTLCAALMHAGWRLLSDELTLLSLVDGRIHPLCRPVSLKNASIDVIRRFAPAAIFSRVSHETSKGSVAHMRVPAEHVEQMGTSASAAWVVFPRWEAGAGTELAHRSRARSVVDLARNAFNFALLGQRGFDTLADVIDACDCFDFTYSRLDDALAVFEGLAAPAESRS